MILMLLRVQQEYYISAWLTVGQGARCELCRSRVGRRGECGRGGGGRERPEASYRDCIGEQTSGGGGRHPRPAE
ncbi:hypothetical protein EVAR_103101_1 [Eumeta japonica]|uniref:Uncharacterized protein n=1 Tax=Eumeta variegata TaxID=151549 RepID=A0A4C1WMI4_EUMVA|nr:hypothetical protein EVAR_103101_1 [Eumeta japonica]